MDAFNFTKAKLDTLPLPATGDRDTYRDERVEELLLRVTSSGVKTFNVFARPHGGRPERVTIGRYPAVSIEQARAKAKTITAAFAAGKSQRKAKPTEAEVLTLTAALKNYVEQKRRKGLPLKERTKLDYLEMVDAGEKGRRQPGELYPLANKPLASITAAEIKTMHAKALQRGERRAAYAAQVLRAVLNWHGIKIADNPFSRETAGYKRITIPPPKASGKAVPEERIGALWNALSAVESAVTDYLRLTLLCGTRPSELLTLTVGDCDLVGGRALLRDTKNRKDHTLVLSKQALEIVNRHAAGKKGEDLLFGFNEPPKVAALAKATGIEFNTKMLRATFASIAESRVSYAVLKKLMNHADTADVTATHYVKISERQLREGWQAVADWIEAEGEKVRGTTSI